MGRQNIELNQQVLTTMRTLIENLHKKNKCVMMESSNRHGNVGSMAVFLLDEKRSYYLFGANDPKMRSEHTGTAVIWESLYKLKELGFNELDLEGVNSPNRGWFKMSFGGDLKTYYQIFTKK